MARELAAATTAAVYARIGTTTQEYGTLTSWLVDVLNAITGNLDQPGGAMFPRAAAGQSNAIGESGHGRGLKLGRWEQPRARPAGGVRRAARRHAGRGDRDRGRGPDPGADHGRRQPGALDAELGPAARRDRVARVPGLGRLLRERDLGPGGRDPAGAHAARARPLRPRLLPALDPQRRQLHAGLAADARGDAPRVGELPAARRDRHRPGPGRRRRRDRRLRRARGRPPRDDDRRARRPRAWSRPRSSPPSASAAGPSGSSTCCCAAAPTAPGIGDSPGRGKARRSASTRSRRPRTASTSAPCSRGCRRCCGRRAARSSSARSRSSPTSSALQDSLDALDRRRWS